MAKKKRLLILSDMHCGNIAGLTPPRWKKFRFHTEMWKLYTKMVDSVKPVDILVVNGDAVDGKQRKSGGIDLLTTDRLEQCMMAKECIDYVNADKIYITLGTSYHTAGGENWEMILSKMIDADYCDGRIFLDVNGVVFDFKHFIPGSQIPHGRFTAIAGDRLWNLLWNEKSEQPKADIIVRSHCHYFVYCGTNQWLALVTPALQGVGSEYGKKIPSGVIDFGMVWFDIDEKGNWSWNYSIATISSLKAKPLKV